MDSAKFDSLLSRIALSLSSFCPGQCWLLLRVVLNSAKFDFLLSWIVLCLISCNPGQCSVCLRVVMDSANLYAVKFWIALICPEMRWEWLRIVVDSATNYPFALQRGDLSLSRRDCLCAVEDSAEIMLDWWLFKGSLNMDALATNTVKHKIFSMLVRKTKILLRVILESNNFISMTSWTVLICSGQRLSALDSAYLPWTALICPGQGWVWLRIDLICNMERTIILHKDGRGRKSIV